MAGLWFFNTCCERALFLIDIIICARCTVGRPALQATLASNPNLSADNAIILSRDFYGQVHYGQVTKEFIHPKGSKTAEGRYEPSRVRTIYKRAVFGLPWLHKISTSYIDRTHLSLRLFNRRFARLTLGYSEKLEYLKYSVALSVAHFNFCRVHGSLKGQTPAMAAGLTDHIWCIADLLTETGQVGDEKWICPLREPTVLPQISVSKAT